MRHDGMAIRGICEFLLIEVLVLKPHDQRLSNTPCHARCFEHASAAACLHESEGLHDNDCAVENLPALHAVQKDEVQGDILQVS